MWLRRQFLSNQNQVELMPTIKFEDENTDDSDLLASGETPLGEANYAASNSVRKEFSKFIDRSKRDGERTLITEHNKPSAAIVPVSEYRILKMLDKAGFTELLANITMKSVI